jgi:hypothetical protein
LSGRKPAGDLKPEPVLPSLAVMKAQPYSISLRKFQLSVVLIIGALHQVLGMLQPILDLN